MDLSRYYDKEGKPIKDVIEWGKLFEDFSYKVIKQETLPNGLWISTVWLGLNHNWAPNGPIHIFESMVFSRIDRLEEQDMERYSTLEQAKAGHLKLVKKWSKFKGAKLVKEKT